MAIRQTALWHEPNGMLFQEPLRRWSVLGSVHALVGQQDDTAST